MSMNTSILFLFIYLFSQTKYMIWVIVDPKMANLFSMTQSRWNILFCFGFIFVYVYNLHLDSQAMCRAKCKGSTSFRPQCSVLAEVNCSFSHFNDLTDTALHTQVGLCYFVSSVYQHHNILSAYVTRRFGQRFFWNTYNTHICMILVSDSNQHTETKPCPFYECFAKIKAWIKVEYYLLALGTPMLQVWYPKPYFGMKTVKIPQTHCFWLWKKLNVPV